MNRYLENLNYANDRRVRARERWYESFDENRMVVHILLWDDDDCEYSAELPVKFEVCGTCEGRGSHVNPSIDCGGLTAEDFDEDPGFYEDYMGGRYDQPCNECNGKRVAPVIVRWLADKETLAKLDRQRIEAEADHAERMAELRYGC
jgi:hypothetical protein